MTTILLNTLAVVLGWLIGSAVNMGLVQVGYRVFPIEGIDVNDLEALSEVLPHLDITFFIFPFLAHALGTFFGALICGLIAKTRTMQLSLSIGALFLIGGIMVNIMIPAPLWFTITDLTLAYIPMAWFGGQLALKRNSKN